MCSDLLFENIIDSRVKERLQQRLNTHEGIIPIPQSGENFRWHSDLIGHSNSIEWFDFSDIHREK